MDRIKTISRTLHRNLRVDQDKAAAVSAQERMIPVVAPEFLKVATQYPIVLTKNIATGQFVSVALCGFEDGENLFWRQGAWDAIYFPLNVARQPFFLGAPQGEGDFVLCIDSESPCLGDQGEALFDDSGAPTAYLRKQQDLLKQLVLGERQTLAFIAALLDAGLLTELALDIKFANGDKQRVQGLYTIDEAKLDALDGEMLLKLRAAGYLPSIYAMIVSLGQIYVLIERKNAALAKASQWFAASGQ